MNDDVSDIESKADLPKRKRRWFQFSLRTLLIVVTLLAVPCWFVHELVFRPREIQREEEAAKKVAEGANMVTTIRTLPKYGYVADSERAIMIALEVWEPIYGKDHIAEEKPYRAQLLNDVWTVEGSLPDGWNGGVAIVEIAKVDGEILRVSHGK